MIILVGPPNSGKTTLFNWLTGSRFKAVNYPGSTVEAYVGQTQERYGVALAIADTPGTYSLFAKSPDEQLTHDVLFGDRFKGQIKGVVLCLDATQLDRQLYLMAQLKESRFPIVIALTMIDLAREGGHALDIQKLSQQLNLRIVPINGLLGGGVSDLVGAMQELNQVPQAAQPLELVHWDLGRIEHEVKKASALTTKAKPSAKDSARKRSDQIDHWLLHRTWGVFAFLMIMMALFSGIFWLADPLMSVVDWFFAELGNQTHQFIGANLWGDFVSDGLVGSFGAVLVFVPQIFILFFGLSFLEDSGYLARAATLVDRPLSAVGLSGRAFVSLLSGYACAVPAIMAARTIRSPRERWIAVFVIPLTSCSARIPVYALLLTFLYPTGPAWKPGLILAAIYGASLVVGALAAGILNRIVKKQSASLFMMELPVYRRPKLRVLFKNALLRTRAYVYRAGPIIFVFALILWCGTHFPRPQVETSGSQAIEQSYAGQLGHHIEPILKPLGVDWRVGIGLISAFAAREVFVSAMALVFDVTSSDSDSSLRSSLIEKMNQAVRSDGRPVFTLASVLGLIIFFMIALQCTSTTAMASREMGSWRFALMQLLTLNVIAYVLAVAVVQSLVSLGF